MNGDRLIAGRYRLVERLGGGGMGVVWRAHDERLQRTVAVKQLQLPPELTAQQAEMAKRRTMREGRIAARVQDPHAVTVYDVTEDGGQPYLVMEYLPSRTLSQVLAERETMPPAEVALIGARAAAGLAAAHAAGVVHRDVKPGNVLLGSDGTVKITDFGISRAVDEVTTTTLGAFAGTPAYLSPEVAKGQPATFASDVFSLGATLYAAVEGGSPFGDTDNAMALLYRAASGEVIPPTRAGPLAGILTQMLSREPDQRPPIAEVRDMLAAVAAGDEPAAPPPPLPLQLPPPSPDPDEQPETALLAATPRRRRRTAALVAAAVALLLLAGTALALALNRDDPEAGTASATSPSATSPAPPTTSASTTTSVAPPVQPPDTQSPAPPPATSEPPAPPAPRGGPGEPLTAITDYYALMPGNLQEGWLRLTPSYQRHPAGGWEGYQRFWNQISEVTVADATASGDSVVEATVEYSFKDGRTVRERHRYTLITEDGRWKIAASTVLSSVTR